MGTFRKRVYWFHRQKLLQLFIQLSECILIFHIHFLSHFFNVFNLLTTFLFTSFLEYPPFHTFYIISLVSFFHIDGAWHSHSNAIIAQLGQSLSFGSAPNRTELYQQLAISRVCGVCFRIDPKALIAFHGTPTTTSHYIELCPIPHLLYILYLEYGIWYAMQQMNATITTRHDTLYGLLAFLNGNCG